MFNADELKALKAIYTALEGIDIVLVGAAALRATGRFSWRTTSDLDLTVALDADQFPGPLVTLKEFERDRRIHHRWWFNSVKIDIIPAGPRLRHEGVFKLEGREINLAGFHLAFAHAVEITFNGVTVRVTPPPVIAILKMFAYADRPSERERDLQDIGYLLDEYIDDDDDRRYAERIIGTINWEHISAHELGYDIGLIAGSAEELGISNFLERLHGNDLIGTMERMRRSGPPPWRSDEIAFLRVLDAFEQGLRDGRVAAEVIDL